MKESLERKKILAVCWQHLEPRKIDDLIEGPEKISLNKKYVICNMLNENVRGVTYLHR